MSEKTGSIKLNFPDLEPDQMTHSCALDVAEEGGLKLEDVGAIMNMTRERVRQVQDQALAKALSKAGDLSLEFEHPRGFTEPGVVE